MKKVVIRATKDGYFVDLGVAQPRKHRKIDGEIRALHVEYLHNGSSETGYYSRARAIEVAHDWPEPVEIYFDEPDALTTMLANFDPLRHGGEAMAFAPVGKEAM